ncbi:uncharacterized protein CCOS01_07984 [Colletotrichum costaricense]|uniref:Uncharacterized protein n=1 Tax=Colletotrichum costaricense TaxID=1209916 RepID=A0AAI9YXX3_9PEZI|nr:uncharacterized protein CCOS01_07984 [Colletotrichum costaricense]KAK1527722.1 hypothetical protein CCOS01_07984 [Colletotrichum costaricense]
MRLHSTTLTTLRTVVVVCCTRTHYGYTVPSCVSSCKGCN